MPVDSEKRRHGRRPFLYTAALEFLSGNREARISDLSPGGCYVDSIVSVTEGEGIALVLTNHAGDWMRFTGQIAYALPGLGFGIRFTNLTDGQTEFIDQLIKPRA